MSEEKIEMICGIGVIGVQPLCTHHRKKCVACKTIKYLKKTMKIKTKLLIF